MRCRACGFENVPDASFCGECGAPLTSTVSCPASGRPNSPKQKFCNGCGQALTRPADRAAPPDPRAYTPKHLAEKILTSRSALEGERKQVTVLFADVQGSMALAEQVDPEEWHQIMDRFFAILSEGIHRFEGTVNQFTGDGIMALFGAPIAHEDHARRACFAALYLRDELRRYADELHRKSALNFSVRMGINSGDAAESCRHLCLAPEDSVPSTSRLRSDRGDSYSTARAARSLAIAAPSKPNSCNT
jgi:hypothetical protein